MKRVAAERFFSKVRFTETCWVWTGATSQGYGSFALRSYTTIAAYRWSFEFVRGLVPKGFQLDHVCKNRICVNPGHLEVVTQKTNVLRGSGPPAVNAKKSHCIHGHEFTPENTYQRKDSVGRKCRTCIAAYNLKITIRRRRK